VLWVLGLILVAVAIAVPVVLEKKPWIPDDPNLRLNNASVRFRGLACRADGFAGWGDRTGRA
jgi:hypothetical protein